MAETTYYIRLDGRIQGPFTVSQLLALALRGELGPGHQVSVDRRTWKPASSLAALQPPSPPDQGQERKAAPAQGIQATSPPPLAPPASEARTVDRAGWQRVHAGLYLLSLSYYCHIGAAVVIPLLLLLRSLPVIKGVIAVGLPEVFMERLPIALFLGCWLLEAGGLGWCISAPREMGGKKLTIPALVLSFVSAMVVLGANLFLLPALPGLRQEDSLGEALVTLMLLGLSLLVGLCSFVRLFLLVGFLGRVAGGIPSESLARQLRQLDWWLFLWVGYLVPGQVFGSLLLGCFVSLMFSNPSQRDLLGMVARIGGGAVLVLNAAYVLGWFLWYLLVLYRTRLAVRQLLDQSR
jgi:hypothetical protein